MPYELQRAIKRWERWVAELARPYAFTVYDYTNDLSLRTSLEKALPTGSPTAEELVRIERADSAFMELTREPEGDEVLFATDEIPWLNRVPKQLGDDFF